MMNQNPNQLLMSEADPKPWWQSTTILASTAVVVSQAVGLVGIDLDHGLVLNLITSLAGVVGGLMAIWGRVRAAQPIRR